MSRELLALGLVGWGRDPDDAPFTIDLDSTLCETYGLAKEGARHHSYTGQRGYHPLLAIAAGTGDVLMARLREGRANTARGAAHFLRETVGRIRYAGARGQLTVRADSGFYAYAHGRRLSPKWMSASPSPFAGSKSLRNLIEAIPEHGLDADSLLDGRRRRCGGDQLHSPFRVSPTPHRCGSSSGG